MSIPAGLSRFRVCPPETPQRIATVAVVDPRLADFDGWKDTPLSQAVSLQFYDRASQALRLARRKPVDLWVVNTKLPDLSGFELCSLLKAQRSDATVFLVADEYSPQAEQAAWAHRATLFAAKPVPQDWLQAWLSQRGSHPRISVS